MTQSPDHKRSLQSRATRLAAGPALAVGIALASLPVAAQAQPVGISLEATPLVLKDGRIARVSVHSIPFPDEAAAPASNTRNELASFVRTLATDCFLTAQVIGHVDKKEISGRGTADIHRLARARADTIQESLVANGLPAASIASVWDWRFMVQQPSVTLWIFRLTAGDDCDDVPLGAGSADELAEAAPSTPPAEVTAASDPLSRPAEIAEDRSEPSAETAVESAAKPRGPEVTTPIPASPPRPALGAGAASNIRPASLPKSGKGVDTQLTTQSQNPSSDLQGAARILDDGALEIIFATNSSYFPSEAGDRLRAFMKTLERGKSYVLQIQTSVDSTAGVSGASSVDEAARYNAWLAERRFKRVEAWLLKNSNGRTLTIAPSLSENDGSRRVLVEPAPLG